MQAQRLLVTGLGVTLLAALAWAATSTNFILDPAVFDNGGGNISSTNFDLHGSINGVAMSADFGGGNQTGTGSSTNFIHVLGFPEGANTGLGGGGASPVIVAAGNNNPGASNELATTTATIPMLQFVVTAGSGGNIFVNSIAITASGSGDDLNDVTAVDLWGDVNANGQVDGGETTVATQQSFSVDNGIATFTPGSPIQINAGNSQTFLVTYTFAGSASNTDTFTAILSLGSINVVNSLSQPLTPSGLPQTGGTKTMVSSGSTGSLTLTVGANNPGGTSVTLPGAGPSGEALQEAWLQFRLTASTVEAVIVNSIRVTATGTLHDVNDFANVSLYRDTGSTPGVVDVSDVLLASGSYSGDNGSVTFTSLGETITAGSAVDLLLAMDVLTSAAGGATGSATIAANTDVSSTGGSSFGAVPCSGAPVGSLRFIAVTPPTTTVTPGAVTVTTSGGGGGGCHAAPPGTPLPAGNPLGVVLPWLLGVFTLIVLRRRGAATV